MISQLLDLGLLSSGWADVTVASSLTASNPGGFAFSYVLGSGAIVAVPEPGAWLMLLLGLVMIVIVVRVKPVVSRLPAP